MPLTLIQQKKRQQSLIWVMAGVILITFLVLWFGFFRQKTPSFQEMPPLENIPQIEKGKAPTPAEGIKKIEIKFEVLENPFLEKLQLFEEILPFEGQIGRENPFIPYY